MSVEGSNDNANWSTSDITGSAVSLLTTTIGLLPGQFSTIAYAYLRVKFTLSANTAILNCDGNTNTF